MAINEGQAWADSGNSRNEVVIYYRRKNGWITRGPTQPAKQVIMMRKGCTPLAQYGQIIHSEDTWGPILRNGGAHEFPVEQVLTYRWYRKDMLPDLRPIVQQGRDFVRQGTQPSVHFPQLAGVKIVEYPCPEPCNRSFHSPLHLGGHLRVMHEYDRSEILKYGEAMGIDFTKVPGGKAIVAYDGSEAAEAAQEVVADAEEPVFATVSAETPATEEIKQEVETEPISCPDCDWQSKPDAAKPEVALNMHRRHRHPEPVPA
jgi:hypothetical protein